VTPVRVRVDAGLSFESGQVSAKFVERLRRALSFQNPQVRARARLGLRRGEVELLCFLQEAGGRVRLPRGAVHVLRREAEREGLTLNFDDARLLPREHLEVPEVTLRDYQARAVDVLTRVTQGTVVLPCGGGKTRVALGAIARLKTPTLVLVHTLDLAEQWRGELRERLRLDAGLIGAGEASPAQVTVALIQALAQWPRSRLEVFLAQFGLLILDEAHHVAASTFHAIVDHCPAKYRLGLTATPEREDGLTPLLELFLGRPLLIVTHDELVAAGVLTVPSIRTLATDFAFPYRRAEDYSRLLNAVAADAKRNRAIVDSVVAEANAGHTCLVLSGRVEHCEVLADAVRARGVTAAALTGKVGREQRKALLDDAREGRLQVLMATSLADEGLDLPRLSRVFLAFPGRSRGRTIQRLGRLMRPHPSKQSAVLFDFVDTRVPILRRHHLERRKLYSEVLGIPASALRAS
jgi:superfamily II DNA or RNA helicase